LIGWIGAGVIAPFSTVGAAPWRGTSVGALGVDVAVSPVGAWGWVAANLGPGAAGRAVVVGRARVGMSATAVLAIGTLAVFNAASALALASACALGSTGVVCGAAGTVAALDCGVSGATGAAAALTTDMVGAGGAATGATGADKIAR